MQRGETSHKRGILDMNFNLILYWVSNSRDIGEGGVPFIVITS